MHDLFERFPDMKPVTKAPTLHTINGVGTTAYGSRDYDPDTGTYVKTVWLTVAFIPILPLGAYRVADAPEGGWYFIGKVPVSAAAKGWGWGLVLIALSVAGYFGWHAYTSTPSYQAGRKLARAESLRKEGRLEDAALLCREVAEGSTDQSGAAMKALADMLDSPEVQEKGDPKQVVAVFRVAHDLRHRPGAVPDLFQRGLRFAEARAEQDPEGSLVVLEAVEPDAPDPAAPRAAKRKVLERLAAARPDDVELLGKLAVVYEESNERDRCLALLEPHAKRLGDTEGARVLGLLYYQRGKLDEAFALLQSYTEKRLKALQQAEQQLDTAYRTAQQNVIDQVKAGNAPGFDYKQFDAANQAERDKMVRDYRDQRLQNNAELARRGEELGRQKGVVTAALDLGMLRLDRAQRAADPARRKAELEQAEKTFLAVRGLAGDQAEYQLSLGQVYYWLGKQAEGRKLFDEFLTADGRTVPRLLGVAGLLRELGASAEARALLEEAYDKPGAEPRQKQSAAALRALTAKDLDDQITWLDRSDPAEPQVKASLAEAKGHKAVREGKDEEAAARYREAVAVWAAQPETPASLNNGGLANFHLYRVSGEPEALERGLRMLEKALALQPGDGILVQNVADAALGVALGELAGDRLDLRKLRRQADLADLAFLYNDADGRKALVRRARESAAVAKARSHYDRALILAPSNLHVYSGYEGLLHFLGERDGLANLDRRAAEAKLDLADARQEVRDFLAGKKDEKYRRDFGAGAARAERNLAAARKAGGVTFAVAVGSLVQARSAQALLGAAVDVDELVQLAEEAHKLAPSEGTRSTLQAALLMRAAKALAGREPQYAALAKKAGRSLGGAEVVAVALWREGKPREAALADADVRRALELLRSSALLAEEPSGWAWAMLRAAHPEDADRVAAALKADDLGRLTRTLQGRLSPPSASAALRQCWALEAAGKPAEARDVLKRLAADGVQLPFDLP